MPLIDDQAAREIAFLLMAAIVVAIFGLMFD